MNLTLLVFLLHQGYHGKQPQKKKKLNLKLLTDSGMLLMVEKGIRVKIFHAIHRYAKANNKYVKDFDKNKESSYLKCWDISNIYGWAMLQKLPVDGFKWVINKSKFNKDFRKKCNEDSYIGYFLKVNVQYREKFHELPNDLPFFMTE